MRSDGNYDWSCHCGFGWSWWAAWCMGRVGREQSGGFGGGFFLRWCAEYFIHDAVLDGLLSGEEEVAVGVVG